MAFQNVSITFLSQRQTSTCAVAPHVLKPVFLNWHSVITYSNIFFKFCIGGGVRVDVNEELKFL